MHAVVEVPTVGAIDMVAVAVATYTMYVMCTFRVGVSDFESEVWVPYGRMDYA